jgi:hypothetical protein
VPTGNLLLRVQGQVPSCGFDTLVYAAATIERSGNEWVVRSAAAASGDFEIRLRQSGAIADGITPIDGSVSGTAIHQPELTGLTFSWNARVDFGSGNRSTFSGFAIPQGTLPGPNGSFAGISGPVTGSMTFADNAGHSCTGTFGALALAAQH